MSYFFLTDDDLCFNGPSDRFARNIDALRLLKELETSDRTPTHEERRTLARYTAFGESALLNRLFFFDPAHGRFILQPGYTSFISEDEGKALRRAALTAFYTPIDIVRAIWYAVEHLGIGQLERPRIIEPAAGAGHFISAMPADLRARAEITAVELDPLTTRMLRQIHPDITVHGPAGFESVDLPSNAYDLAISNVPFGDMAVRDPLIPEPFLCRTIHDYFFGKAIRLVRPGGLIVFLTSWGTLDKQSTTVRAWLAEHTELLGAWRLPHGVFRGMSGSDSASDLLILQKRGQPCPQQPAWINLTAVDYPHAPSHGPLPPSARYTREMTDEVALRAAQITVNQLWVAEPERVIGQPTMVVCDHSLWLQVTPPPQGTATVLRERLKQMLPAHIIHPFNLADAAAAEVSRQPHKLHLRADPIALSSVEPARRTIAAAMESVYHAAKEVIRRELQDEPEIDASRATLNQVYDDFVACHGVISDPRNQRLFRDLPELAFLLALEQHPQKLPSGRWRAEKARIFFTRTLRPIAMVRAGTLSPHAALLRCLDEIGELDIQRVAALSGHTVPQVVAQLGDVIFRVPGTHRYVLADEYLSGNIRAKLREAGAWAAHDVSVARHVTALEAVLPPPLGSGDIIINLNAYWLPAEIVTGFIMDILPKFVGQAHYDERLGEWVLRDFHNAGVHSVEATSTWGTKRADAITILRATLKGTPITVYDEITAGDREKQVLNPAETAAAQEKQDAINRRFAAWVWEDAARAERLIGLYNELFNAVRLRQYNGMHLTFPGMATHILRDDDLADYQKGAVWQVLQNQTALLAFAVGGGKTFTAIAAMVEAKRMGLINKALAVVPNNLVGQWASEARRLYPGIRVLAMGPEDFERRRRGVVLARMATGDWDIVIVAHTSFTLLPIGLEVLQAFRDKETDRLRAYLEELRAHAVEREEKRSLKQIEKAVAKLEARLDGMTAAIKRDSERTIRWEELGIDMLVVDEAQEFKNLPVSTRLTNIAGLPVASSQRALDMRIKSWDLIRRRGKVVFLTATPIMNTIGEAYIMQLYLQEAQLEAVGIHHFDAWVSLYAQPRMAFEMKPDGSGFRMHTRLNTFVNIPEMAAMWRQVLNVKTKVELRLSEPTMVTGKVIPVVVPASSALKRYIQHLAARVDAIRLGQIDPSIDNYLKVTGDGRKAALDIRLVIPSAPRPRQSKIAELVKRVALIYNTFNPLKGTQLIFCDLATPKGRRMRTTQTLDDEVDEFKQPVETTEEVRLTNFVYHDIRSALVRHGIPLEEIAFIHDYTTKAQRDALFCAMNDGRVRVLIGSTGKMSTGMNVQQRLIALHDLDCPWRPGDLEQRHGRILRQGNSWPQIYIFAYITEGSFDGYSYQTIESKARFIAQALAGEVTVRSVADVSEMVLSAAEVKAIASGNPAIVRKVQLETELGRMERVRAVHLDTQIALRADRLRTEGKLTAHEQRWVVLHEANTLARTNQRSRFVAQIAAQPGSDRLDTFVQRTAAGNALNRIVERYRTIAEKQQTAVMRMIGQYRGFTLQVKIYPGDVPEMMLLLPNGTSIERIHATTDSGLFASADGSLRALPDRLVKLDSEIRTQQQRIRDIDRELARMVVWDGQTAYDAAMAELQIINAAFAAQEAQTEEATRHQQESPPVGHVDQTHEPSVRLGRASETTTAHVLAEVRALLIETEAYDDTDPHPVSIPPAPRSLALIAVAHTRREDEEPRSALDVVDRVHREQRVPLEVDASIPVGAPPAIRADNSSSHPTPHVFTFGNLLFLKRQRKTSKAPHTANPLPDGVRQLELFAGPAAQPSPTEHMEQQGLL